MKFKQMPRLQTHKSHSLPRRSPPTPRQNIRTREVKKKENEIKGRPYRKVIHSQDNDYDYFILNFFYW